MSNFRSEHNIPVVRDNRTFEQRREAMLSNLEQSYNDQSKIRPSNVTLSGRSDTTASSLSTDTLRSGSLLESPSDEWFGEVGRWISETRRRWDDDTRRMRQDMFALEPIDRFDDWGKMKPLSSFDAPGGRSNMMMDMERKMQSLRQEMDSMSPFGTSRLGGPGGTSVQMSRTTSSSTTSTSGPMNDPRGVQTKSNVQESVEHSKTVNGVTTSTKSTMSSSSTGSDPFSHQSVDAHRSGLKPIGDSKDMMTFMKDAYEIGEDGQVHFRVRFDAKDFAPEDIDVSTAANQLTVLAKKSTPTSNKEFCRTIELPRSIDHEHFQCNLTGDGVLILDAPVKAPDYNSITFNQDHQLSIRPKSERELRSSMNSTRINILKPSGASGVNILNDGIGGRKLRIEVEIDPEYAADDITVRMDAKNIIVSGKQQHTNPITGGQGSTFREFTKTFEVPETLDPFSVTSQLSGRVLIIEAPLRRSA